MAANNYYLGLKMSESTVNIDSVVTSATTNAGPGNGTASDVELRIQTDSGSGANGITRKDVLLAIETLKAFIESGNPTNSGANLPVL
jgi:hypothetical protein